MNRFLLLAGLLFAAPALAQAPTRVGPLSVQNRLGEIASDGTGAQATARANLGLSGVPLAVPTSPLLGGAPGAFIPLGIGAGLTGAGSQLSVVYGTGANTALQGSLRGVANGVAGLDAGALVPLAQLPSLSALGAAATANNLSDLANAATARANLGLGTIATQSAGAVAITGGTIAGTPISGATGAFSTLSASGTVSGAGVTALLAPYATLASPSFTGTIGGAAMALTGNATIGSTLGVTGATTLAGGTFSGTFAGAHTYSGALTLSAAGTALNVTNNATIGGTLGVTGLLAGTSETLTGNFTGTTATFSGFLTEGGNTVVNPALILNGNGTGQIGIRFQVAGANRWRWITTDAETGNNTGSDEILQSYTDAGVVTNLTKITRSSGLFQHNSNMLVVRTVNDNSDQTALAGQLSLIGQGEFGVHFGGAFRADNIGYVPNLDPAWAAGASYSIGNVVNVNGSLLTATSAGVSGGVTPACAATNPTCSDGGVSWSYLGGVGLAYQMVGGFASANMTNSFGGVAGAPIGGVFGLNTQANVRVANGVFVIGYELNYGAAFPVLNRVGLQIVGGNTGAAQGTQTDVGLRFEGQPGFASLRHIIDIGGNTGSDILDPNGYVMRAFPEGYNQGNGPPILMAGAGALDFLEFTATGSGEAGGGFILRGPGSQILTSGDVQSNYALLHQTATGASLDASQFHVTSAAIHAGGGGTNWTVGKWFATCSDGSLIKVTGVSGGAVTSISLIIGAYVSAASSTVTCTSEQVVGAPDNAGNGTLSSPVQVDMGATLANTGAPVLALGGVATVTAPTASVGNNSPQVATTAFVQAQVSASITAAAYALPTATATVLGGVEPDGTTIANTAGAISVAYGATANTAAQGNDSRITGALSATTAAATYQPLLGFTPYNATNPSGYQTAAQVTAVLPVASSTAALAAGTAAAGVGTTWARADHVHPTDTTRAPLASPTFTGTINAATIVATGAITGQSGLTAGTSTAAQPVFINGPAGANRNVIWQTAGVKRFQININGTAEGGANVGSDVAMSVSDDTGTTTFTPISITRSTGLTTMNNLSATMTGGTINNVVIGGSTALAGTFTTLTASSIKVGASPVVGARQTGWTAMTGTPDLASSFATSTVTLAQLAGRVMSLQAAMTTHGLIGP